MRIYVYSDRVTELECKADKKKGERFYVIRGMFISVRAVQLFCLLCQFVLLIA